MDPKLIKKTQDSLGAIIKKPPLTDKLLGKPPFRFLHDIMTSVIKTTGFMQGLYSDLEMNSENVKDKDAKIAFLQKAIDIVGAVTGKSLSVKPVKVVAGHEPEKTNEFLQALATAINKDVNNEEYVQQVLRGNGGGGSAKEEKRESHKERDKEKDRDRTKSADRRKAREEKDSTDKEKDRSRDKGDRDREKDKSQDRERRSEKDRSQDRERRSEKDKDHEKERRHEKDRDRHKDRESKTREKSRDGREDRHKDKSRRRGKTCSPKTDVDAASHKKPLVVTTKDGVDPQNLSCSTWSLPRPDAGGGHNALAAMGGEGGAMTPGKYQNDPASVPVLPVGVCRQPNSKLPLSLARRGENLGTGDHNMIGIGDHREKENESPEREKVNGERAEKQEAPSRLQRPSSAKGSRRRREAQNHAAAEDEEFQKPMAPSNDAMFGEGDLPPQVAAARQLARPSSARPAPPRPKQDVHESEPAMRLGGGQPTNLIVDDDNEEDEDENFLVEETAPPPPEPDLTPSKPPEEEDAEHGALVKKMLESKKELEGANQTKKTEIERPIMSDAQRRKQREQVQKEVDKLRTSIQSLTRSANPLGKVMDYVQEDLDAMQQELDKWRAENAQHALDLKREMNVTDRAIDPLRQQLSELDRAIADQLGQIAATKSSIIRNDQKIQKMLQGISSS